MAALFALTSWFLVPLFISCAASLPILEARQSNISQSSAIPNHYIFLVKEGLSDEQWQAHQNWSSTLAGEKKWTYNSAGFRGYCGNFSQDAVQQIAASDDVSMACRALQCVTL